MIPAAVPVENFVLFKYGLKQKILPQIIRTLIVIVFGFVLAAFAYGICYFIPDGIGWFILEFFFVTCFAAGVYILCTCRTKEFKYYFELVKNLVLGFIDKIKKTGTDKL